MKTAISIPDDVFEHAKRAAKRLGVSRSELITRAVREYLDASRDESITASYNKAFSSDNANDEADFRREAVRRTLLEVEWNDE